MELHSQYSGDDRALLYVDDDFDADDDLYLQIRRGAECRAIHLRRPEVERLYAHLGELLGKSTSSHSVLEPRLGYSASDRMKAYDTAINILRTISRSLPPRIEEITELAEKILGGPAGGEK